VTGIGVGSLLPAVLLGAIAAVPTAAPPSPRAAILAPDGKSVAQMSGVIARGDVAQDTIEIPSTPLESAAVGFAQAFALGSEDALGKLLWSEGIRLQLAGSGRAGLSARQAVASLMEFLRPYDRNRTLVSRAAPLEGSPDRGFAEVLWTARAVGTSDEVTSTLFLGLRRDEGDWKIDEVRILR
jgi:hypothetical protein